MKACKDNKNKTRNKKKICNDKEFIFTIFMNMEMFMTMPMYMGNVIEAMMNENWFVTIYDEANLEDIYNPCNYIYNKQIHNCTYKLVLDRNIFSYIVSTIHESQHSINSQNALGLILFCQRSDILIEPSLAIHEYINFMKENIDRALDEIETFRMIDSYSGDPILDYFEGRIKVLPHGPYKKINRKSLKQSFIKKTSLRNWNKFYITNLKLAEIYYSDSPSENKFIEFVTWMSDNFQISFPAFLFAAYLFSDSRLKDMVKYKPNTSTEKRKQAIKNMTWDIYFIQQARETWERKAELEEVIFATNDRVIQKVLRTLLLVSKDGDISVLNCDFSKKDLAKIITAYEYLKSNEKRLYKTDKWNDAYIKTLTNHLETSLFS